MQQIKGLKTKVDACYRVNLCGLNSSVWTRYKEWNLDVVFSFLQHLQPEIKTRRSGEFLALSCLQLIRN